MIMEYLFNEDNKAKIIEELNKSVNIPIINEDTEEKVISAIYNVFQDVMGKVLVNRKKLLQTEQKEQQVEKESNEQNTLKKLLER